MKKSFTEEMTALHTWSGLIMGWALFPIFLTGALCVFWMEINVWARPESHALKMPPREVILQQSADYLAKNAPGARRWTIDMPDPDARDPTLVLAWQPAEGRPVRREFVPDGAFTPITTETHGGRFFVDFHWNLNTPPPFGPASTKNVFPFLFVGAAGIAFLIGTITGVLIHKKIFKDFFTFRPRAKSKQRAWLDAHNVLGVLPWPFHVMIIVTGLAYMCYQYIPAASQTLYGTDRPRGGAGGGGVGAGPARAGASSMPSDNAPIVEVIRRVEQEFGEGSTRTIGIRNPGRDNATIDIVRRRDDQIVVSNVYRMTLDGVTGVPTKITNQFPPVRSIWDVTTSIHFVFFGGTPMRFLYLVMGLVGAGMMACGLLLFTVKRREKAHSEASERFYRIVDRINVAAVGGSMFACIAYMWGTRLLPTSLPAKEYEIYSKLRFLPFDQATRQDWEIWIFWFAWFAAMAHAALRRPHAAWVEQLSATAILCLALPLNGFFIANSNLFAMIAAGDWKTAGVDLTALLFGVGLAWAALKVSGKRFARLLAEPRLSPAE